MRDLSPWLGLCHIRKETDDTRSSQQTLVAAWADSAEGFEREVHFHTNTHGLQMILAEEVLPATEWMAKHPDRKDAQRLAAKVSAKHPVEIGAFGSGASGTGGQPDEAEGYLHIEEIKGVEPLDSQFGVHPPKTVPDALYQPLFGQPDPTPAEVAQYGGVDKVLPLSTYAILDAAKVVNFVEMLEASGLEHRCLFKGKAAEEMRDVAPYVVRLEEDVDFTRNLFSHDPEQEVPWFMWEREPGIYVRSRGSLGDIWKHFRKFTKVQDEDGKWFYFRFWEPLLLITYLKKEIGQMRASQIVSPMENLILIDTVLGQILLLTQTDKRLEIGGRIVLGIDDFELMKLHRIGYDSRVLMREMYWSEGIFHHENGLTVSQCVDFLTAVIKEAKSLSLTKKEHIMRFAVLCEKMGIGFINNVKYLNVQRTIGSGFVPSRIISELEYDVKEIFEGKD